MPPASTTDEGALRLVYFHSETCDTCQTMEPLVIATADQYEVPLVSVDVEAHPPIAAAFGVRSTPTLVFVKKDQEIFRQVGLLTQKQLEKIIQSRNFAAERNDSRTQ